MKLVTTTSDFKNWCSSDADRIREIHRAGFRYIDLNLGMLTPDCVYMQPGWQDEVERLKELSRGLDMQFVQAHSQGIGSPLSDNADNNNFYIEATKRSIEICGMLGIKNTVVHEACKAGLSKYEMFEVNKDFYNKLFPTAEKFGVNILCENSTRVNLKDIYCTNTGADMREFIEYIGHPLFHACWDIGHANCEKFSMYDNIMTLGDELYAIHYHDNHCEADEHLAPYLGNLNHDEVINALIDVGYKGYFTLEADFSLRTRLKFEKDNRLQYPKLFMQRHIEAMMYDTAKWMLETYGLFEE